MKRLWASVTVLLVAAAYLSGRWPERERRLTLAGENAILQERVEEAEAAVRMCDLLGQVQNVIHAVSLKNYGEAQGFSSVFFDAARAESGRTVQAGYRQALEDVLSSRDAVTAALAQADPKALEKLGAVEARLKSALGHGAPRGPIASPTPSSQAPPPSSASKP
jgi:hypothetical protein